METNDFARNGWVSWCEHPVSRNGQLHCTTMAICPLHGTAVSAAISVPANVLRRTVSASEYDMTLWIISHYKFSVENKTKNSECICQPMTKRLIFFLNLINCSIKHLRWWMFCKLTFFTCIDVWLFRYKWNGMLGFRFNYTDYRRKWFAFCEAYNNIKF